MSPCYYCGGGFQDHDKVVALTLKEASSQSHGGVLFTTHENVYVHQQCLGDPNE